jgi:prepilin-type N-terminal cleavage/methylation domain-containing protein
MKTISAIGNKNSSSGFTFLEILAVVALMSIVFAVAATTFFSGTARLKSSAYQLSRDIQGAYFLAIKKAKVIRIAFQDDKQTYYIQTFEAPKPRPKPEDRKAYEEWEATQKELDNMNAADRSALTRLERGSFKTLKTQKLFGSIELKSLYSSRAQNAADKSKPDSEPKEKFIFFLPNGEADQALLVLTDGSDHFSSLEIHPLTGKVTTIRGEITEEEWKKRDEHK